MWEVHRSSKFLATRSRNIARTLSIIQVLVCSPKGGPGLMERTRTWITLPVEILHICTKVTREQATYHERNARTPASSVASHSMPYLSNAEPLPGPLSSPASCNRLHEGSPTFSTLPELEHESRAASVAQSTRRKRNVMEHLQ